MRSCTWTRAVQYRIVRRLLLTSSAQNPLEPLVLGPVTGAFPLAPEAAVAITPAPGLALGLSAGIQQPLKEVLQNFMLRRARRAPENRRRQCACACASPETTLHLR